MSDTTREALACPFCGSTAGTDADSGRWVVNCDSCLARMDGVYASKAEALADWNRRAALATPEQAPAALTDEQKTRAFRFLTDAMTAAGLLSHGMRDRALAERVSAGAVALRFLLSDAPSVPEQAEQPTSPLLDRFTAEAKAAGITHLDPGRTLTTAAEQAEQSAQVSAQGVEALTDEGIEAMFRASGGRWGGDYWVIEDADLHPFVRAIASLSQLKGGE